MKTLMLSLLILGSSAHAASGVVRPVENLSHRIIRLGLTASGQDDHSTSTEISGDMNATSAERACLQKQISEISKVGYVKTDIKRGSYWVKVHLFVAAKAPESNEGLAFVGVRNGRVELVDDLEENASIVVPFLSADGKCLVMDTETLRRRYYETFYPEQSVLPPDINL
ncbi:MAG: hypothetical protein K2Q26_08750 [Bdellovibrionales bacterium]|nr:hypothetical protein [Bdellovibrionales bacterium]